MSGRELRTWLADETLARVAWARLAEPSDRHAAALRALLGPQEALAVALGEASAPAEFAAAVARGSERLPVLLDRWQIRRPMCDPRRDIAAIEASGGQLLVPGHPDWPARLGDLGAAEPVCLWVRGTERLARVCEQSVALVGSRAATRYGEGVAADLAAGLAGEEVSVLSGAAFGIDAAAHRAALAAGQATVAVLACGADVSYPAAHGPLLDRIAETGLVVSELPPGAIPTRWRFLERNRIIAALAPGTVVVEAAWRSGALSTARHALSINRHLGAVPGPVTSAASAGCHRLLRDGAVCITGADDVVELIRPIEVRQETPPMLRPRDHDGLDPSRLRVWEVLAPSGWASLAQVCAGAGLGEREVLSLLHSLRDEGRAQSLDAGHGRILWRRSDRRRG